MKLIRKPLLLIIALIMILGMLRLGLWQLDRADEKQTILDQQVHQANSDAISIDRLIRQGSLDGDERFRQIEVTGRYNPDLSILIDNQVVDSRVGYQLFTAMELSGSNQWVFVNRGWLAVGKSRATLPTFSTQGDVHTILGRLNIAPSRPPMLSEDFVLPDSFVWPYLSIEEAERKMKISLLPLVVELAPDFSGEQEPTLQRRWREVNDRWVATHRGYAFQWFAMAFAFLVACIILLIRAGHAEKS